MLKISRICKNLKELGLRNCDSISEKGFSYLENLEFLEHLDLYRTHINTQTLCKILRRNVRMRHLRIGGTDKSLNVDEVAMELKNSCPDLESIDLWKTHTLTHRKVLMPLLTAKIYEKWILVGAAVQLVMVIASVDCFPPVNTWKKFS
ncbi:F-box/LRR-repeat protein 4 [Trachymyrmex cornetzi]|uniref:F-box/LRR-repeat protein 4 n=1 Tax=Trachymyrmex cornetzi TaxID=471704 RepID=A0A151J833_9HYME|nr:F-box/LRR-repeat protein 4 [Trachymyrmex cornetzi]